MDSMGDKKKIGMDDSVKDVELLASVVEDIYSQVMNTDGAVWPKVTCIYSVTTYYYSAHKFIFFCFLPFYLIPHQRIERSQNRTCIKGLQIGQCKNP